jgi:membrane-associated phospholipid phosphatase
MGRYSVNRASLRRRLGVLAVGVLAAGGGILAAPSPASAAGPTDHVLYWNDVLLRTYRQVGGAPGPLARAGGMLHGAVYDAANSALCATSQAQCLGAAYKIKVAGTAGVVPDLATAIDYAAYNTLRTVYPSISFDADLATAQEGIADSAGRTDGQRIGGAAAQAMIDFRVGDGSPDTSTYPASTTPGVWRETGSGPAATPSWGLVRPFTMTSGSQFRPAGPAGYSTISALLASPEYAAQVNEVKALGRATGSTRTADQTQAAWFWANDLNGTYKPPGQLFALTQIVAKQAKLTQAGNARLFALVGLSMADAAIAAWDAKYLTDIDLWRPETAIQLAGTDGNAATTADTAWKPLSADQNGVNFSPSFPAYISGHATFAASWAEAMRSFFGSDTMRFTGTTEDPHAVGVTRSFTTFSAAATENARSRIYLGVHYQFDADSGISTGTALASNAAANFIRPTSSYTFTGFYDHGGYVGDYTDVAAPHSFLFQFSLTDSGGNAVTDLGAIVGTSWNGFSGTVNAPTFNAATGRYEIPAYVSKPCSGNVWKFSVLLRDGSSHSVTVDCNIV